MSEETAPGETLPEPGIPTGEPIAAPPAAPAASRHRRFTIDTSPLRERPFRRLWTGQTITVVGTQMTLVVVPYQVFTVTGSSLAVGLTSIVALVPLVVFGLIGGLPPPPHAPVARTAPARDAVHPVVARASSSSTMGVKAMK